MIDQLRQPGAVRVEFQPILDVAKQKPSLYALEGFEAVRVLGINKVQGWLHSRAIPAQELAETQFLDNGEK